jgi:hypothetical protein
MRRAFAIVPLLSIVMLGNGPDNYFRCTTFPDYGLHITFVVHYAFVPSGTQQVVLLVSDQQTYPCTNYQLDSGVSVTGQTVRVSMSGNVIKPDVCVTSSGPAQYQTALPLVPGTYALEFARSNAVDRYRLTVTPSAIEITTIESSFTRPM